MKKRNLIVAVIVFGVILSLVGCGGKDGENATITFIQGTSEVQRGGQTTWAPAEIGMKLTQSDIIRTLAGSKVDLSIGTKGGFRLEENAQLSLAVLEEDKTLLDLSVGKVFVTAEKLSKDAKFEVKTPTAVASIRGTAFLVEVAPEEIN